MPGPGYVAACHFHPQPAPMSAPLRQDEHQSQLRAGALALAGRAESLRDALSPAQLAWKPAEDAWSVAQVFEHLCIADASYLGPMEALVTGGKPEPDKARAARWKPTVMGNLLVRSFRSPRRLPAPKIYRPPPAPRDGVIPAWLGLNARLRDLLDRAADLVWTGLAMPSPVTRLIRLNLGDAFLVLVSHAERHLGQAGRVRALPGFPA